MYIEDYHDRVPPCAVYSEDTRFWTITQGVMQQAFEKSVIYVTNQDHVQVPFTLIFHNDGRIEIMIKPS